MPILPICLQFGNITTKYFGTCVIYPEEDAEMTIQIPSEYKTLPLAAEFIHESEVANRKRQPRYLDAQFPCRLIHPWAYYNFAPASAIQASASNDQQNS